MGKGSEPDDALSARNAGAGARRHRRRSTETGSEFGSRAFRSEQRRPAQAEAVHDNNPKGNFNAWDCESNLYDSFELFTFLRHLDGVLQVRDASNPSPPAHLRSFSMPHYVGFRSAADDGLPEGKAGRPDFQNAAQPVDQRRRAKFPWWLGKLMKGLLKRSGGGRNL